MLDAATSSLRGVVPVVRLSWSIHTACTIQEQQGTSLMSYKTNTVFREPPKTWVQSAVAFLVTHKARQHKFAVTLNDQIIITATVMFDSNYRNL